MIKKREIVRDVVKNIGLLNDKKIKEALLEQERSKERLSQILVRLGFTANVNVGLTLIPQIGILPITLNPQEIQESTLSLVSPNVAILHRIVPIKQEAKALFIGTDDPLNFLAEEFLRKIVGVDNIEVELVQTKDLDKILEEKYSSREKRSVDLQKVSEGIKDVRSGEDAPIIKLVNLVISDAVKKRSSDIHIEPLESKLRVRYRIDGVLHEVSPPPKRLQGSIISRLKIMAGMNIAEKRQPQDGRIKINIDKKELDLRVSTLPATYGESVVARILDKSSFLIGLEDLGFLPNEKKAFEKLIGLPNGMILVTGPTGSGKTTTLYATLSQVNQKERKVITIEDPVEYQLDGINQVQVKPQIGLSFAIGLRSMLRQAPDIIMVGEIRDLETAQIAVQSALTGHLIFSTLHTNDAAGAVTRLVDMGIKPYLVASTVQGVLAQRLVRTICPSCRVSYNPSDEEVALLSLKKEELRGFELYKGKGCPSCNDTGYKGRVGIFELFTLRDEIRELVINNVQATEITRKAKEFGMKTLKEDGLEKVKKGFTTTEEILRVTQDV